jgi:hypothetical protein
MIHLPSWWSYTTGMKKLVIFAAILVALLGGAGVLLRQLPTHSAEAQGHVQAMQGLVDGLKESLPAVEPIIQATSRVASWASQKPSAGAVSVRQDDIKAVAKQLDTTQDALIRARASWVASDAEAKVHAAKLKSMLSDAVWPDQLRGTLRTGRDLILLLGWPLALALVLAYVLHSDKAKDRIVLLAKSIQKVSLPGGFEVTLWGDQFRQDQSDTFKKFRADVQAEYDKLAERRTIKDTVARILKEKIEPELKRIRPSQTVDYRATVHVRDALFTNSYYQLIDYLPTGGNRGRAWSMRFGMVGRAWRLQNDSWNGEVPNTPEKLMEEWGMIRDEALGPARQTMLCSILKATDGTPVGAFYMDAKGKDEFGSSAEMKVLADAVHQAAETAGLTAGLAEIWDEIKKKAPLVEIYGNRT